MFITCTFVFCARASGDGSKTDSRKEDSVRYVELVYDNSHSNILLTENPSGEDGKWDKRTEFILWNVSISIYLT